MAAGPWIDEVFRDRTRLGMRVARTLFDETSEVQRVRIVENEVFGRTLVLDGLFQTCEMDGHVYHEMLVHPALLAAPRCARVLVIGGGDGGTAREVLRHPEVEELVQIEIDELVVEACRAHLPSLGGPAWEDPRLDLRIGDGVAFVKDPATGSFDVILLDGSDPVGPSRGLFDEDFYRACRARLTPGGVLALQSESYFFVESLFLEIQATLRRVFPVVRPLHAPVPLYGVGAWTWTWASDAGDPREFDAGRAATLAAATRYYTPELHRAAFALPGDVTRKLTEIG